MQFDSIQPRTTSTPAVLDVTVETFQKEVVERSKSTPVLLDFWATWCGPCKSLSPTLEKLARESKGKFLLAKVDIDQNPELADAFGIQSVPTVALLVNGQIVDGFVGAQPESKIREILARHGAIAKQDRVADALAQEKAGDAAGALTTLRSAVRDAPSDHAARAHLARLLLASGSTEEGQKLYESLPTEARDLEPARAAKALLDLAASRVDLAPLEAAVKAQPADVAARLALGRALLADQKADQGLEQLLAAAKLDLAFEGGAPRKALIEAFGALGESNPLVTHYRRELSILLCG